MSGQLALFVNDAPKTPRIVMSWGLGVELDLHPAALAHRTQLSQF